MKVKPMRWLGGLSLLLIGALAGGLTTWTWERQRQAAEAPSRCWEAVVFLPITNQDGRPFSDSEMQEAIALLVRSFGGATLSEIREGYWSDGEKIRREPVRPVAVSFERNRLAEFRRVVTVVGRHLGQKAMYLRLEEPRVEQIFVEE